MHINLELSIFKVDFHRYMLKNLNILLFMQKCAIMDFEFVRSKICVRCARCVVYREVQH